LVKPVVLLFLVTPKLDLDPLVDGCLQAVTDIVGP